MKWSWSKAGRGARMLQVVGAAATLAMPAIAAAQTSLTGATIYGVCEPPGAACIGDIWNTANPGSPPFKVFFSASSSGTPILNPLTTLNAPLSAGSNTFYLFTEPGINQPFFGVNLYLGGATTASLSTYAPSNGTGTDFASNVGQPTYGLSGSTTEPGGPLSVVVGGFQYTITYFAFNTTQQFGDVVGGFTPGASGINDYVGRVTINVTAVPEPSTIMLTATGLSGLLGMGWRRRRLSV